MSRPEISVVVPCYRSAATLGELVRRLGEALEPLGRGYEVLLVNDASGDGTWEVICELAAAHPEVRGWELLFNTGQHRATLCGLEQARGELVVTMDDDLQQPPEAVPALLAAIEADPACDAVIASFPNKRHGWFRNLGSRLMARLFHWLYHKPLHIPSTSFRVLRRRLVVALCAFGTRNPNVNPLIFQSTARLSTIQVQHHPRAVGRSGYGPLSLLRLMMDNVFNVSTLPLKLVSGLGFTASAGSVVAGIYYLVQWSLGTIKVAGFATQVLLIIFFGGLSLFSIGLLGEYLIRIMEEVRGRPRYLIRDHVGRDAADE